MKTQTTPSSIAAVKQAAKALRQQALAAHAPLSQAQALEQLAHEAGHRDWNTYRASLSEYPLPEWQAGHRVTGRYLTQDIAGRVLNAQPLEPGWTRLSIELDEAVDVVTFDSFSAFRKRLKVNIGPQGFTRERTSDGRPHCALAL